MHKILISLLVASVSLVILGLLSIYRIGPHGFLDMPGGRRKHASPIPRVGGITFFSALILTMMVTGNALPLLVTEWVGLGLMFAMGVLDDRFDLRARWKAILGLCLALLLAKANLSQPVGDHETFHLLWFSIPNNTVIHYVLLTTLFWAIPQAFNLIDGANGLAIGYGIIVAVCLAITGTISPLLPVMLAMLLFFNWPQPRLFLGDAGSLTLGLLFAVLGYHAFASVRPNSILWLFAYPTIDVLMVMAIRLYHGNSIFKADRNHLHHHLLDWFGEHAYLKTPLLWLLSAGCAAGSLVQGRWRIIPWVSLTILLGLAIVCFGCTMREKTTDPEPMV